MSYTIIKDRYGNDSSVMRTDGLSIPFDPDNMDFVEYNKWLALGNQPLPPDEPTLP
jgi:hypothetical protein